MSLGREVLIIKIKLDNTLSDIISVHERDEPSLLAARFCKKHKLPQKAVKAITYMIDRNLDILIDEELASQSPKKAPTDLYSKGMSQKAKLNEKIKKIKDSIDEEKNKFLTFKPILCQQSVELLKNSAKTNRPATTRVSKPDADVVKNVQNLKSNPCYSFKAKPSLNNSSSLVKCSSFNFQSRPLSIFQNFKDFSNEKLKSMIRNN
jgi:hypothetical protein